ncbi:hypothetical protein DFH09DRAFT_1098587 [Mycena vulgaris]|nr:hypothetical protein DFH09DRAFT_1098587 [Mycena vulgaris]
MELVGHLESWEAELGVSRGERAVGVEAQGFRGNEGTLSTFRVFISRASIRTGAAQAVLSGGCSKQEGSDGPTADGSPTPQAAASSASSDPPTPVSTFAIAPTPTASKRVGVQLPGWAPRTKRALPLHGEDDVSADWMPDTGPWPAVFHAAFFAQVWCTYRAGFEPIRDLPGLGALPAVGGIPAWVGAGALNSTHENGEHAGESNGHAPPPVMSYSPSQSDSSYWSISSAGHCLFRPCLVLPLPPTRLLHPLIRHVDIKQRQHQKEVVAPALPRHGRHEGLDERRGVGVHAAHGARLAGECIGDGWGAAFCTQSSGSCDVSFVASSAPPSCPAWRARPLRR